MLHNRLAVPSRQRLVGKDEGYVGIERIVTPHLLEDYLEQAACQGIAMHVLHDGTMPLAVWRDQKIEQRGIAVTPDELVQGQGGLLKMLGGHAFVLKGDGNKPRLAQTLDLAFGGGGNRTKVKLGCHTVPFH